MPWHAFDRRLLFSKLPLTYFFQDADRTPRRDSRFWRSARPRPHAVFCYGDRATESRMLLFQFPVHCDPASKPPHRDHPLGSTPSASPGGTPQVTGLARHNGVVARQTLQFDAGGANSSRPSTAWLVHVASSTRHGLARSQAECTAVRYPPSASNLSASRQRRARAQATDRGVPTR
jgi:hypothetical protein